MYFYRLQEYSSKIIVKVLSFIAAVVRQKKKIIVKLNMIAPILAVLFPIICSPPAVEDEEEHHSCADGCDDAESHTPDALAAQVRCC